MSIVTFEDREWQFRIVRCDHACAFAVSRSEMAQIRMRMQRELTVIFRRRTAITVRAKRAAAKQFSIDRAFEVRDMLDDNSWRGDENKRTTIVNWAVFVVMRYVETGKANWTFNDVNGFTLRFADDPDAQKTVWEERTGTLLKNPTLLTIDADMLRHDLPPVERIDVWA